MKFKTTIIALLLSIMSNSYATEESPCSRLTGSWYGAFWLKDPRECHIYHGCKHSMLATVTHVSDDLYRAEVHPHVGREGVYNLTCKKGIVTTLDAPGIIEYQCIDRTICQVKYDDNRLSANL